MSIVVAVAEALRTMSDNHVPTSLDPPTSHTVFAGHSHGAAMRPRESPAWAVWMEAPAITPLPRTTPTACPPAICVRTPVKGVLSKVAAPSEKTPAQELVPSTTSDTLMPPVLASWAWA